MRTLDYKELEIVSGGDWTIEVDIGIVRGVLTGTETIQDMAGGLVSLASDTYWAARDGFADLWNAWDPAGYYTTCGGGGGR